MEEFQTSTELADYYFDFERRVRDANEASERYIKEIEQSRIEKERERQEKERERERGVMVMLSQNLPNEMIVKVFDITVEDIAVIQERYKDEDALTALLNGHRKV